MNSPPLSVSRYFRSYQQEFQRVILEKSENFIGRGFVFDAIHDFLGHYKRGYFIIVGVPGSGKSAILAQFVNIHPLCIYYSVQVAGKNRVEEFLQIICTLLNELLASLQSSLSSPVGESELLIENAAEGSWLLSLLLQQVSDNLADEQKLVIIIDGLDGVDLNCQPLGTNLFYLPRYLPDNVFFLLSRRPYHQTNSGLLIEAPVQILDLSDYQKENAEDIKLFIQQYLSVNSSPEAARGVNLIAEGENNFMYVQQVLQAENVEMISPGLEAYYLQHWGKIQGDNLSDLELQVLRVLTAGEYVDFPLVDISQILDVDAYDVAEVLENWFEFLMERRVDKQSFYRFYHDGFRVWLGKRISGGVVG